MRKLLYAGEAKAFYSKLHRKLKDHYRISMCSSGPDAIEDFLAFQPHILIIDTAFPGCDVVGLLHISQMIVPPAKTILIDSGCRSFVEQIQQHIGLDVLLNKPVTIKVLAEHIHHLNAQIQITTEVQAERLLSQLGIGRGNSAFSALYHAIIYKFKNPDCLFTSDLVVSVAKMRNTTPQAALKVMSRCIKKMWRTYDPLLWDWLFPTHTKPPSSNVFLTTLVQYMQQLPDE